MTEAIFKLGNYLPFRLFVASSSVSSLLSSACDVLYDMKMAEWRIIAALSEFGPSTQFSLCRSTFMDKVSISRGVQSLIQRKLIYRTSAMRDGRSHLLDLTPAGRERCGELIQAANRYEAALVADFSPEEVVALKSYLIRLQIAAESARHPAHQAMEAHKREHSPAYVDETHDPAK
jgi:DNA-binding MarR family transcriptional regulator